MNTNLGDAAFDAIKIYKTLFEEIGFQKAFIPLKTKLTIEGIDYTVNENGIPCCPHNPSKVKKLSYSIWISLYQTLQESLISFHLPAANETAAYPVDIFP